MKAYVRFSICMFAGLALAMALVGLLAGGQPVARAAEMEATGNLSRSDDDHANLTQLGTEAASTCFTEYTGDNVTDFASADMQAVQNAVNAVSAGGTVKVAGYCPGVQYLGNYTQTVWISKSLTLQGGYTNTAWLDTPDPLANPTTLDAQGLGRVIYVGFGADARLFYLNITNGWVDGDGAGIYVSYSYLGVNSCFVGNNRATMDGGGLYNRGSWVVVRGSTLFHNSADDEGGGIHNWDATITITDSIILSNTAGYGGGIYNVIGNLFMEDSSLSRNSAQAGGGIYNMTGTVTLAADTFLTNTVTAAGGGIYNYFGTLTVTDSDFSGNEAGTGGGGIRNNDGVIEVADSTFSDNHSLGGPGGAIRNLGPLMVTNGTFLSNSASGDSGGGIYNEGALTVADSTFLGNIAAAGGGIRNESTLTVTNSTISGNSVDAEGGGVLNAGQAYIGQSEITGNYAGWGGGLSNYLTSTLVIEQSSLSHNTATDEGGALYNRDAVGKLTLVNSTVYSNTANWGGGILTNGALTVTNSTLSENATTFGAGGLHINEVTIYLRNTIIANSIGGDDCEDYDEPLLVVNESNLIEDGTCNPTYSGDPSLGMLGLYDGTTDVLPLLPGSPAIDRGNDAVCSATPVNGRDQRNLPRPQGAHCDIGAFEQQYTTYLPLVRR